MRVILSNPLYGTTLSTIAYSYRWLAFMAFSLFVYASEFSQASEKMSLTLTEELSNDGCFRVFKAKEPGAVTETLAVHFPAHYSVNIAFDFMYDSLQNVSAKTIEFPDLQQYLALPAPAYPGLKHKFLNIDKFFRSRFSTRRYLAIVYPLFQDGDLHLFLDSLQKTQSLASKDTIFSISRSILKGLKLLHEKAYVIHGNLNPQNILLRRTNDTYSASITNMASNLRIGVKTLSSPMFTKQYPWVSGYIPFEGRPTFGFYPLKPAVSYDVFSFGSVLYELVMGQLVDGQYLEQAQHDLRSRPETNFQDSPWLFIISKCWSKFAKDRPTVDKILEWLDEFDEYNRVLFEI